MQLLLFSMEKLKDRLRKSIENKEITAYELSAATGVTQANISRVLNGKTLKPNKDSLRVIADYLQVNSEWLIYGKGEMLRNEEVGIVKTVSDCLSNLPLKAENLIPLYFLESLTAVNGGFSVRQQQPIDYIYIPNVTSCDGAAYVKGNDSMAPFISRGDVVLYKNVGNIPAGIFFGDVYLIAFSIAGSEFITINYVRESENKDMITLSSFNQDFKPQDIPIKSVKALAHVKASIKYISMM